MTDTSINITLTVPELPTHEYLDELTKRLIASAGDKRVYIQVFVQS